MHQAKQASFSSDNRCEKESENAADKENKASGFYMPFNEEYMNGNSTPVTMTHEKLGKDMFNPLQSDQKDEDLRKLLSSVPLAKEELDTLIHLAKVSHNLNWLILIRESLVSETHHIAI